MNIRVQKLFEQLDCKDDEAIVLHSAANIFYISGYTGEGLMVIGKNFGTIITDFRYTEQAENQAPEFNVIMPKTNYENNEELRKILDNNNISKLYYEDSYLTVFQYIKLKNNMKGIDLQPINFACEKIREVKDTDEIGRIEKACEITSDSFMQFLPNIKEGLTEKQLALKLEFIMRENGGEGLSFDTIVAAGANGSLPHAIPSDYTIKKGELITFDFGIKYKGYCADMTRTVALGQASDTMLNVYNIVQKAQSLSQSALKPGAKNIDIDSVARDYIYSKGFEGRFGHGLGHSVGICIHEDPRLSQNSESYICREGNVITVEPGIYLPGIGGVRIENTCVVTQNACRALTKATCDLIVL